MLSALNMRDIDYGKTTHKSDFELSLIEKKDEVTKTCCREIVMAVLNLKCAASATEKSRKAKKSTAQTAQHT
jgi:hypothetical protein